MARMSSVPETGHRSWVDTRSLAGSRRLASAHRHSVPGAFHTARSWLSHPMMPPTSRKRIVDAHAVSSFADSTLIGTPVPLNSYRRRLPIPRALFDERPHAFLGVSCRGDVVKILYRIANAAPVVEIVGTQ